MTIYYTEKQRTLKLKDSKMDTFTVKCADGHEYDNLSLEAVLTMAQYCMAKGIDFSVHKE